MPRSFAKPLSRASPRVASEWHPTRNGSLSPDGIAPASNRRVWWLCSHGHEWQATPNSRTTIGSGCSFCSGRRATDEVNLAVCHPQIAAQCHPTRNGRFSPTEVRPRSHAVVWWLCAMGHEYKMSPDERVRGRGCGYCSGRYATDLINLAAIHPDLAKEWHPTLNAGIVPSQVTPSSGRTAWWRCPVGHDYRARVYSRAVGNTCPECR
ncbi:MAG: zinc-ribbon domain-containing protein, partial [Actinomycetota bacterium]|nr:zinc-ribbon domain-containing protein [Actinomycetota bacterium]